MSISDIFRPPSKQTQPGEATATDGKATPQVPTVGSTTVFDILGGRASHVRWALGAGAQPVVDLCADIDELAGTCIWCRGGLTPRYAPQGWADDDDIADWVAEPGGVRYLASIVERHGEAPFTFALRFRLPADLSLLTSLARSGRFSVRTPEHWDDPGLELANGQRVMPQPLLNLPSRGDLLWPILADGAEAGRRAGHARDIAYFKRNPSARLLVRRPGRGEFWPDREDRGSVVVLRTARPDVFARVPFPDTSVRDARREVDDWAEHPWRGPAVLDV